MSYELKIDPKKKASGRFIGKVRKALLNAALEEKKASGISQQQIADAIGVNRSVINRILKGETNLTLRSIAEISWALGWEPVFSMHRKVLPAGVNHGPIETTSVRQPTVRAATSAVTAVVSPTPTVKTATTRVNVLESAL